MDFIYNIIAPIIAILSFFGGFITYILYNKNKELERYNKELEEYSNQFEENIKKNENVKHVVEKYEEEANMDSSNYDNNKSSFLWNKTFNRNEKPRDK